MAEIIETTETTTPDNNMYIDTINELKQNTVSKAQYEQLQAENKKLLDSLANGDYNKPAEPEKPKYDMNQLRENFQKTAGCASNIEPWKAAIAYRKAHLAETGRDCFIPNNDCKEYNPTQETIDYYNDLANLVESCIEDSNGSDKLFFSLLCDRTTEDPTLVRAFAGKI